MTNKLVIDLPASIDLPPDVANDQKTMRDALAAVLYKQGRISPSLARAMMGVTRRQFEDRLADFGYAVMDEHDFDAEIAAIARLSRRSNA
jgi:predicted HTH domain antitoxin